MRVKLLRAWNGWRAGHVFAEMPRGQARVLVKRRIAELEAAADNRPAPRRRRSKKTETAKAS